MSFTDLPIELRIKIFEYSYNADYHLELQFERYSGVWDAGMSFAFAPDPESYIEDYYDY